jgi:hypothetical protein
VSRRTPILRVCHRLHPNKKPAMRFTQKAGL